jgi:uncharacterized protein (DUF983 family)
MMVKTLDAWKVTCPQCGGTWFEFDNKPLEQCPHCGAEGNDLYSEEPAEAVEVNLYMDVLTGVVESEVADR